MSDTQIIYLLASTILIPCVLGLVKYKVLKLPFKLIVLLLFTGLFTEAVMIVLSTKKINNLFAVHFYALAEIIFFGLFFFHSIKSGVVRKLTILSMVCLAMFAVIYALFGNNIAEFNSIPRAMECLYFTTLSAWLFYEMADYHRQVDECEYYFNGTVLFYFSSCFVIFAFNKYVATNQDVLWTMVKAHSYVNAACNILYALGIWIASKSFYHQSSPST